MSTSRNAKVRMKPKCIEVAEKVIRKIYFSLAQRIDLCYLDD